VEKWSKNIGFLGLIKLRKNLKRPTFRFRRFFICRSVCNTNRELWLYTIHSTWRDIQYIGCSFWVL